MCVDVRYPGSSCEIEWREACSEGVKYLIKDRARFKEIQCSWFSPICYRDHGDEKAGGFGFPAALAFHCHRTVLVPQAQLDSRPIRATTAQNRFFVLFSFHSEQSPGHTTVVVVHTNMHELGHDSL